MFELPSFVIWCIFLVVLLKIYGFWKSETKLPPGPWRLPVIGNLHQLIGSDLPHQCLSKLAKKHGPIMFLKLGARSATIISSSAAAEAKLKTNELCFAQRPTVLAAEIGGYGEAGIIYAPYGDYWRQIRKFCILELLSSKRVKSFKAIMDDEVQTLIHSISSSTSTRLINLSDTFLVLTTSITSRAAFGNKCKDSNEFIETLNEGLALAGGFYMLDYFPVLRFLPFMGGMKSILKKSRMRLEKVLNNIINDHRAKRVDNDSSNENDLVDVLLKLEESNDIDFQITPTNIKGIIFEIFAAGTETSAVTMEWAMSEMLKNPKVMKKAQDEVRQVLKKKKNITEEDIKELHYLKLVIKETLRLHPPLSLMIRECTEKCKIHGYDIPLKSKVIVNFWAIGRDPQYWSDNADCFIPERFEGSTDLDYKGTNFQYFPFGAGRRICPGILFANTTIELSLALLLFHFDWSLPNDLEPNKLDMTEAFGMTVKRKNPLYVIATPSSNTW